MVVTTLNVDVSPSPKKWFMGRKMLLSKRVGQFYSHQTSKLGPTQISHENDCHSSQLLYKSLFEVYTVIPRLTSDPANEFFG